MDISESARQKARDFIENEKQFHLGFLPTEQSNPITMRRVFAAQEWIAAQDWSKGEEPSPVQVVLGELRSETSAHA